MDTHDYYLELWFDRDDHRVRVRDHSEQKDWGREHDRRSSGSKNSVSWKRFRSRKGSITRHAGIGGTGSRVMATRQWRVADIGRSRTQILAPCVTEEFGLMLAREE